MFIFTLLFCFCVAYIFLGISFFMELLALFFFDFAAFYCCHFVFVHFVIGCCFYNISHTIYYTLNAI